MSPAARRAPPRFSSASVTVLGAEACGLARPPRLGTVALTFCGGGAAALVVGGDGTGGGAAALVFCGGGAEGGTAGDGPTAPATGPVSEGACGSGCAFASRMAASSAGAGLGAIGKSLAFTANRL